MNLVEFSLELVQNQILNFDFLGGGGSGGGGLTIFFWHESSSWVEIRLHTEFGRVWLCRS